MKERLSAKRIGLLIVGLLLVIAGTAQLIHSPAVDSPNVRDGNFGVLSEESLIQVPFEELPPGALYITEGRRAFERGGMRLMIPSIGVDTPVGESTLPDGLEKMPGLFEFSQLPGEGDLNVSIAGHRDIHDSVFYDLDKVAGGDYLYVVHDGFVFRYLYKDTRVIRPDDWDAIRPQGFSALTLVTCDPIGTTLRRLIVRAELVDYQPLSDSYYFAAHKVD